MQAEKLIALGPTTDTYRTRLKAHRAAIETDKKLDLTLRTKYNIFDSDTLLTTKSIHNSYTVHSQYSDLSLPQSSGTYNGATINHVFQRKKSHRRTVSDSSKDRKAGAYVHVKGKRKAPRPPIEESEIASRCNTIRSTVGTLSPGSTLGRKKRRAPPPPLLPSPLAEEIPTVLANGLFDDDEIKAIMSGEIPGSSSLAAIAAAANNEQPNMASTDTLKLERGLLKSNREKSDQNDRAQPLSPSAISPRPWYKRSPAANKDYAIPFKKEIMLRTMEKRKTKQASKEIDSPQLPEVGFSRNSYLFDGFFSRSNSDKSDDLEKRRSGIGMPNISELDREAAEIVSKEQATEREKKSAENYWYYLRHERSTSGEPSQQANPAETNNGKRTSTKDLISKFEKSNPVKLTLNSAFVDQADRQNLTENVSVFKYPNSEMNKLVTVSASLSTASPATATPCTSFFRNISSRQAQQILTSEAKQTDPTTITPVATINPQHQENKTTTSNTAIVKPAASPLQENSTTNKIIAETVNKKMWICSYCTLENQYWRVICEVCERFRPYDRPANNTPPTTMVATASTTPSVVTVIKLENNIAVSSSAKATEKTTKDQRTDWETKAERVMKYFRPKSSGNSLSKSASETSVGKSTFTKKSASPSKLLNSPKLQPKIVDKSNPINAGRLNDTAAVPPIDRLIDSSEVIKTTVTTVFDSGCIVRQSDKSLPNIEEIRMARLAKFSDCSKTIKCERASSVEPITKLTADQLNDPVSLEREKLRLREMIRAMNARALAEKYPVIQKSSSLDETVQHAESMHNISTPKEPLSLAGRLSTNSLNMTDTTKTGAIKKLFNRKPETIDDKEISDSSNYSSTKSDKEKLHLKVSSFAQTAPTFGKPIKPDVLLLPSPIQELNEDERSPSVAFKDDALQIFLDDSATGHIDKDLQQLEEISQQFHTQKGLEDFKATLRTSSKKISNTNTLALNKILKNLESAIANGQHERAAELAMDLAKMKVSLSVTKQKVCVPIMDDKPVSGELDNNSKSMM